VVKFFFSSGLSRLGHSNSKSSQSYLAGFEDESKKETLKALTAF
jgi:hypothetical protein